MSAREWRCACGTMLGELRARDVLIVIKAKSKRARRIVASYPVVQTCPTCEREQRRESEDDAGSAAERGLIPGRRGEAINEGPGTWIPPMRP